MNSIELDFDIEHAKFDNLEGEKEEASLLKRFISAFLYAVAASGVYLCSLVGLTFLQFSQYRQEPIHFYLISVAVPLVIMLIYLRIARAYHQIFPVIVGVLTSSVIGIFTVLIIEENMPR